MDLENQLLFKMNKITKYTKRILPFLFGLAVFMFFSFSYGFHLHYQEQLEMFLFTSDYFNNLTSLPGGFADYIGTFFTQFYYFSWLGALIIATMLVLLQQQVAFFANKLKQDSIFYPLTFIPSFLFWALLCDENFMLTALIAVISKQDWLFPVAPVGIGICVLIIVAIIINNFAMKRKYPQYWW